ncbi:MAG: hypothetical protein WCK57_00780 [Verrucomicrobiae bacterium]
MKLSPKPKHEIPKIENASRVRARSGQEIIPPEHSTSLDHPETLKINGVNNLQKLLENAGARGRALNALLGALEATRSVYCPKTKTMVDEPDHRVRAAAAVDLLCFTDGKPVERREQVNINVDGSEEAQRKILSSPALRAAIRKKIEEADDQKSRAAKQLPGGEQNMTFGEVERPASL